MGNPGEVNQAIGRAYQFTFIAALQASIQEFENLFTAESDPEKVSFESRTGKSYSFDFLGHSGHREVFGESKGYSRGGSLLREYKRFLAKAYVTANDYKRHKNDLFWFVTNVPFACTEGITIRNREYIFRALTETNKDEDIREILGSGHIDRDFVFDFSEQIGVFILTDSFLENAELLYRVQEGDTIWDILKKFHAGRPPRSFGSVAARIAKLNQLESPDKIKSGSSIRIPWLGIDSEFEPEYPLVGSTQSRTVIPFLAAGQLETPNGHCDDSQCIRITQAVAEEHLVHRIAPTYPSVARDNGVQGSVALLLFVGRDGIVKQVTVLSGNPLLTPSAVDAVQKWQFKPYLENGEAVAITTQVTLNFTLSDPT